jgi:hypothetical protein
MTSKGVSASNDNAHVRQKEEIMQQNLVVYQVCVDRPGEDTFEGTGKQFDDKVTALEHLAQTRLTRPHAYLAIVTMSGMTRTRWPHLNRPVTT